MDTFSRRHFEMDFLKWKKKGISIKISLKFVPKGPLNNIRALVQIMAWRRPGAKPLSEPILIRLPMHICGARPQWVNTIDSRFIAVIYNMIVHTAPQLQRQNFSQTLHSRMTPHTSPLRASCGVSFVSTHLVLITIMCVDDTIINVYLLVSSLIIYLYHHGINFGYRCITVMSLRTNWLYL